MKFLIIFLFYGYVFAEANKTEEPKVNATEQKQKAEKIEKAKAVTEEVENKIEETQEPVKKQEAEKIEKAKTEAVIEEAQEPVKKQPVFKDKKVTDSIAPEASEPEVIETDTVPVAENVSGVSAEAEVKYICDEGRSYTFYEPGNDPNNLCELDAGHTEQTPDWYALHDSSFCKRKAEELISMHNCAQETK